MGFIHKISFKFFDIFPKKEKYAFVVKKRTNLNGNLLAMIEFLLQKNKKIIIYKHGKCLEHIKKMYKNKIKIYENSLNLYDLVSSKYIFLSHSPFDGYIMKKDKNRIVINLWHGVPFKKIGLDIPNISEKKINKIKKESNLIDILISSSEKDKEIMTQAFGISPDKVHITGLPRYELLHKKFKITKLLEDKLINIKDSKYLVLYAPTLREKNIDPLEQLTQKEIEYINDFAKKNNFIFAIRSHYYEEHNFHRKIQNLTNIVLLNHKDFFETNTILKFTDILITDFSSIWIDYLLLNRPILGFAKDFEHFLKNERGFYYDFNDTFPDTFFFEINSLLEEIKNNLGKNKVYNKQLQLFHKYPLKTAFSKRIYNLLYKGNISE